MKTISFLIALPVLLFLGLSCSFHTPPKGNPNLEDCIYQITKAFHERDSVILNQFIHPDYQLYVLFKRGTMGEYAEIKHISFNHPVPDYPFYTEFKADHKIAFQALPVYDCDSSRWSSIGLFCDSVSRDHLLSNTAIDLKKWREEKIEDAKIQWFKDMENQSRRIVLIDDQGGELIFYLTLIDNKWYLTILDRLSGDCSA